MRIALRTSGGRGEYELAGRHGSILNRDLFGLSVSYEISPSLVLPGHISAQFRDGKPRMRLEDAPGARHAASVIAATLILPQPIRELRKTGSSPVVLDEPYSISDIDVDVAARAERAVTLRPTAVWIRNQSGIVQKIEFAKRMAIVVGLWDAAEELDSELGRLIKDHRAAVTDPSGDHRQIIRAADALEEHAGVAGDAISTIRAEIDRALGAPELDAANDTGISTETDSGNEEDESAPEESSKRQVAKWRLLKVRGAAERKFSLAVKDAYNNRCLFSGDRLPKIEEIASPGVDAAHIVPWSIRELNKVNNGICLNKLCHWAFDAGVLRLDFSAKENSYILSIPETVRASAASQNFDLTYFQRLEGKIPRERLPADKADWPLPRYLAELNQLAYG